jgi:acyl-coenzyme A thioesterase PaaI-like protein
MKNPTRTSALDPLKAIRFLLGVPDCDRIVKLADMQEPLRSPKGEPMVRTIAMPADANPSGDIFGGWLMAQMDLAAGRLVPQEGFNQRSVESKENRR